MSKSGKKKGMIFFLLRILPKRMRNALLRKMLKLPDFPEGLSLEIAKTQKDLDAVFEILYDTYRKEGITNLDPSRRRVTIYHSLPSTTTLVAKQNGEVVATMSLIRDGIFGMPMDAIVDLSQFREAGERLVEVSSLAVRHDFQGHSTAILFYLSKYVISYCREFFGIDRLILAVHPKRLAVYEAIFLVKPFYKKVINEYQFANDAPAVTATLNLQDIEARFYRMYHKKPHYQNFYRFLFKTFSGREKAATQIPERTYATIMDPVLSPELMQYFFSKKTNAFETMTDQQIQELMSIYSHSEYQQVLPGGIPARQDNKRKSVRYDMCCYGLVYPEDKNKPVLINVLDVSESGMLMKADIQFNSEDAYTFFIVIGKQKVSTMRGQVKWSKNNVVGVEFAQKNNQWNDFIQYQHERIVSFSSKNTPHQVAAS